MRRTIMIATNGPVTITTVGTRIVEPVIVYPTIPKRHHIGDVGAKTIAQLSCASASCYDKGSLGRGTPKSCPIQRCPSRVSDIDMGIKFKPVVSLNPLSCKVHTIDRDRLEMGSPSLVPEIDVPVTLRILAKRGDWGCHCRKDSHVGSPDRSMGVGIGHRVVRDTG